MTDTLNGSITSRLAVMAKNMYSLLRCRAQRIESFKPPDKKYGKYWRDVAILCIQRRINPLEFIEVQFYTVKPFPEIRNIVTEAAVERYYKLAQDYAASFAAKFNGQLQVFERLVEIGKEPKAALLNEGQRFDPLFTYSVAASAGFQDVVRDVEEEALTQYITSVHYDQVYRDVVPESFKSKAREVWEGANASGLDGRAAAPLDQGS